MYSQNTVDSLLNKLEYSKNKSPLYNLLAEAVIEDSLDLSMLYARQALIYADKENNIREKGVALFSIAEVFSYNFELDSAVKYYERSLTFLNESGDHYYISYTLNNLGWIYNYFGKYRDAIHSYSECIRHLDTEKYPEELPNVFINIGNAYHHLGSYNTAIGYFHRAIAKIRDIKDKTSLPIAFNGLGLAWKYLSNYDSAFYYYKMMLEIDKKTGTPLDVAIDLGNIGALYFDWGQFEQSYKFHLEATRIFLKEGNKNNISVAYNNLGEVHKALGNYDSSLYYLNMALKIDLETGMENNTAERYNNIGDLYFAQQNFVMAFTYYQLALEINKKIENPFNIALNLHNLANVWAERGESQKAEELFFKSLKKAQDIQSASMVSRIYESLSKFYANTNRFALAYKYHNYYDEIRDSIFKEENKKLLADMQARHELDQKEKAIALLNAENKLRTDEARQYRNSTYFFALALLVISVSLIVMIYQFNLRKKAYKKLVQKNKQLAQSGGLNKETVIRSAKQTPVKIKIENGNGNGSLEILEEKLNRYLDSEKPFLNPNLTMKDMAAQLATNTHYLSEVINQKFGNNFTGLINELRVQEACRLLVDETNDHLTIESIANEAGFNSKSAFNNSFKSVTGLTPSYYKKTARAKK
ncbi:MAG: AraC family transcriptional regulator [Bacteroidales bacterium]|nr:AraC family transcriptional regulator [Bacteroidales bacterium]